MLERIICLLIGYIFGNFQTAYIYGKMKGIDIREHGSGNAGTTNTLRVLGNKAGAVVFVGDVLKCALAIISCKAIYGASHPEMLAVLTLYASLGTILGHNFPALLGFRGGKGMACTAGFMAFYNPWLLLAGVGVFIINFMITHYVSLGSLLTYAAIVITMAILCATGALGVLTGAQIAEIMIITLIMAVMAYVRHWSNIKRLIAGNESKTYFSKKKKEAAAAKK